MSTATEQSHVDVLIVGAGISGIGAAYRLQEQHPDRSYLIVEGRDSIGGTWDLFRYPGIRSDSDMFTLSYPFHPWQDEKSIADGTSIREYLIDTAATYGIDAHIRFGTKVERADWSSRDQLWTVQLRTRTETGSAFRELTCSFLYLCTGYYSYDEPYRPEFPGIDEYAGVVADPQFWPEDLDYRGKRVVVIGSGATAVTIVPAMAEAAEHVTMLQRTPTYMAVLPLVDETANKIRKKLPAKVAHSLLRKRGVLRNAFFYSMARKQPERAKAAFRDVQMRMIGDEQIINEHLTPPYEPWDQRLCAVPDGDFFTTLADGNATIVTDHIDRFVPEGILLKSGQVLEADIVVPATGLAMQAGGGIQISVDDRSVDLADSWLYKGFLLSGVPNLAWCIGYATSSWTLRSDLTSRWLCKLLRFLDANGYSSVVPVADEALPAKPLLPLSSGYVQRAAAAMPKQAGTNPWLMRANYLRDALDTFRPSSANELRFTKSPANITATTGDRR